MPISREVRTDAVGFLVDLVAGAHEDRLLDSWRRLGREGGRPAVMEEAARLQVRSALGAFCERLPAGDLDETAEVAVTALAFGRARAEEAVALALDLCRSAHLERRRAVFVKGAAFVLAGLYTDEREIGDADLAVEPGELGAWRSAAEAVGGAWQPMLEGNYEVAKITRGRALVELHVALPGDGGHVAGPAFEALWPRSEPVAAGTRADVRVPRRGPAREIAVHHAVFHHRGDPEYVLRALQDVARLEPVEGPEGETLFGREDVATSVALFRRLAVGEVGSGQGDDAARGPFVEGLLREGVTSDEEGFARGVDEWLAASRRDGRSGLVVALKQSVARETGIRRLVPRLARLVPRYLAGRFGGGAGHRRREEERWVSFLSGGRTPPPAS